MNELAGKKIILGVTGSIACYKSVFLLRLLQQAGAEVQVITTDSAEKFVSSLTFFSLSRKNILNHLWTESERWSEHVHLGLWADLYIIAPCTAHTLAKLAHGLCDNMLSAVYLSANCPVWIAPAMDLKMYQHPTTQQNLALLKSHNTIIIEPNDGYLASGLEGKGRMAEPEEIIELIKLSFTKSNKIHSILSSKKILVTAGPTQEKLDPVRYLSNYSTGKMGIAIAEESKKLGAEVHLLLGPTNIRPLSEIFTTSFTSAYELFELIRQHYSHYDIIIMTAAVADYSPLEYSSKKIKKNSENESLTLQLKKNPDILAWLGTHKLPKHFLVGFALETDNEEKNALLKLINKKANLLILNSLNDQGAGFGLNTNQVSLLNSKGVIKKTTLANKNEIAKIILETIAVELNS